MLRFFVRVVLGASALTWNSCAASNNLGFPNSIDCIMNYNGVACDEELHVTTEKLCFQAAKKFKITKKTSNALKKFPYGCSLRGKTVNFSNNKSANAPKMTIKTICMSPPVCGTSEPTVEPSMNPSNKLSMVPTESPTGGPISSDLPTPDSTCITFCDQHTFFTFNGPKQITSASNVADYTDVVANPPMDYVLRFTIKPTGVSNNDSNIMHFTIGGDICCTSGTEGLEVFFLNNKIWVRIRHSKGTNTSNTLKVLTLNIDYDVKILVVGTLQTISIDGVVYSTATITDRSQLSDLKVYISDPWSQAANAIISNVYFGSV